MEGEVPIWPMNGRSRVASPTMSCGAKVRIGFCTELSGSAAKRAASRAKDSAASWGTVRPTVRSSSKAIVYPFVNVNGVASAPQFAHRTASGPIPSTRVSGHSAPQPAQTGAQYGSPLNRPSIAWSLPDAVASEVTSTSLMRIAIASPTCASATATGWLTSCPPRIDGVIIGPQQPGVEFQTMWPPLATGPSIGTSGPSRPLVKVLTKTVCCTSVERTSAGSMAMKLLPSK